VSDEQSQDSDLAHSQACPGPQHAVDILHDNVIFEAHELSQALRDPSFSTDTLTLRRST
jgi:hypothetical protein